MDKKDRMVTSDQADLTLKLWETPTFERYDVRRETRAKFATVTEFTSTTGPGS